MAIFLPLVYNAKKAMVLPMKTIDEQIAELEEQTRKKVRQLKAKKELIEARKVHALIKGKRSDDTRRKILAGAMTLEISGRDEEARLRFIKQMDKFLIRPDDRALFGLSPLASVEAGNLDKTTAKTEGEESPA
jgi:large subunit ribosomal protein L7/L12